MEKKTNTFFFSVLEERTNMTNKINTLVAITTAILLIVIVTQTYLSNYKITILLLALLVFILLIAPLVHTQQENFFFEVSPERKKCLEEQVSLTKKRTCECCGLGTVGGVLPVYKEWTTPNEYSGGWIRTDNVTLDKRNPILKTQLSPMELVTPNPEPKRKLKRTQVDLYTQTF